MVTNNVLSSRQEWLDARSTIGGSDAAAILGISPYKSSVDLWEEKTGRKEMKDISDNPYVKYGTFAEKYLRGLFALDYPQYEVCYEENNIWHNDKYPFGHASLDGWLIEKETGRKGILEIKTANINSAVSRSKWDDKVPDHYYAQVIWYMMITEFDFAVLKAQLKSDSRTEVRHYFFERKDCEEDIKYMSEKAKEFAEYIEKDECPPLVLNL